VGPSHGHEHELVKRFRGVLVFKAHRLVYHSTLGLRVMKKKKRRVEPAHVHEHEPAVEQGIQTRGWSPNHHDDKVDSDH